MSDKKNRRKGDNDSDKTVRIQPVKKVVEEWFSDEKDGTEPPTGKRKKNGEEKK
jgi:hypothetical protein